MFKLISFVLKGAQTLVLYNEQFAHFYTTYFGVCREKITIIKNPAFKRESAAREPLPDEPTLLFAGRFVKYKNLERVIRAFSHVRRTTGKGKLVLIGKGPEEDRLKEVVKECSVAETVIFANQVPQEELFNSIRSSAVCLGPALSEFNPNFVLECLSFGKPVLLSRGHGLSVDLPDEFLFNPLDQEELEIKIKSLLSVETYGQAVKKIASIPMNHTWEDIGDAHVQAISKALKSVSYRKTTE
jgi:glycosyltransferase involved in cell wall biosynthesis